MAAMIRTLIFCIFIFNDLIFPQFYKISGNITTSGSVVKHASVSFVNANDSLQHYSTITDSSGNYQLNVLTRMEENNTDLPEKFELTQNYPNPFSHTTAIEYKLNEPANINLVIYDMLGQEVKRFILGEKNTGINKVLWNGRNNFGQQVSPGIYLYQLVSGSDKVTKKNGNGNGQ